MSADHLDAVIGIVLALLLWNLFVRGILKGIGVVN
jgi:hypothetical protein